MNIKTPIAGCTWADAHGSDGTIAVHEIDHKPYVYTTVGYLLRSDEIGVSIAFEQGEDGKFRDITFIPRAIVINEFPISPKSPKRSPRVKKNALPHPVISSVPVHDINPSDESRTVKNDSKPSDDK